MKIKGKNITILLLGLAICGILINIVSASSYYSSLEMDTATLKGATRYYSAGTNKFFIKPTKLTPQEAGEYVQLRVQLNEDTGSMCVLVGTRYIDMYKKLLGQTYDENFETSIKNLYCIGDGRWYDKRAYDGISSGCTNGKKYNRNGGIKNDRSR